jgi:hypothetical protein
MSTGKKQIQDFCTDKAIEQLQPTRHASVLIMHHKIKIYGGNASTALFLSQHQMEASGQLHAPSALPLMI